MRVGEATDLPYPDKAFDACLADTVLQHVPDPALVVSEMARVTRPGGRVAALEFDLGTTFLDHPDSQTTQIILDTFTDAAVQGRIGRQVPRLFRLADLATCRSPRRRSSATGRSGGSSIRTTWTGCRIRAS